MPAIDQISFESGVNCPDVASLKRALEDLRDGKPTAKGEGISLDSYEKILGLERWSAIEKRFSSKDDARGEA